MGLSDFPRPCITALLPWDSRCGPRRHAARPDVGSPSSPPESFRACLGSKTARGPNVSRDNDTPGSAFRTWEQRRHPEMMSLSRLNVLPARTPTNASPVSLRTRVHSSGPMPLRYCATVRLSHPLLSGSYWRFSRMTLPGYAARRFDSHYTAHPRGISSTTLCRF